MPRFVIIRVSSDLRPGLVPDHLDGMIMEHPFEHMRAQNAEITVTREDGEKVPLIAVPTGWHEILSDGEAAEVLIIKP